MGVGPRIRNIIGYSLGAILSAFLLVASFTKWIPSSPTEVFGFVTGAWCVWLTVKEHIWNFPIGNANSAFFLVLFVQARLFADSTLQVIYIVLGFWGWYWWLKGGENQTVLKVMRTPGWEYAMLLVVGIAGTVGMMRVLISVNDSAPLLDALTTVLSLIAQYMLTRKYLENWFVWITADVIYVGLYSYRHLYLTGILYAIFIGLCIAGYIAWSKSLGAPRKEADMEIVHA